MHNATCSQDIEIWQWLVLGSAGGNLLPLKVMETRLKSEEAADHLRSEGPAINEGFKMKHFISSLLSQPQLVLEHTVIHVHQNY